MLRKPDSNVLTPKVIIFDVDGVLFNTDELMFRELQRALAPSGIAIDEVFYARNGYDDCLDALDIPPEQREVILRMVRECYYTDDILPRVRMKPGVLETLKTLSPSFSLAIGSGETKEQLERYLHNFSIAEYFSFIGHGALVKGRKSNPEYFRTIMRHYGVSPQECLHVGDTPTDQNALRAGIPVIIIPTDYSRHFTFDPRCRIVASIGDLPGILARSQERE
ncbi:MAG: HAD hydrolase-like protein [Candidatus Peribacteraceae bacterium]|nr:HAD hydrolase-like protein [Candidatus Peribacteraceae bacterium]MDD5739310.1 HAD hydrolase-like protein [Candidatus Peribacteraceae bacterium]